MGAACRPARGPEPAVLTLSTPYVIESLDPHARDLVAQNALTSHVYDPLVRADGELRIVPALAERWLTPDPKTWVFHLRPGVRFHDGRPLEAADVVATFARLRSDPTLQVGTYAADIESVSARGALVVEIRTFEPTAMLVGRLARIAIVPRGAATEALRTTVNGTGPYRVQAWEPGARLQLVANPSYWGVRPAAERADVLLGRSPDASLGDVLEGRAHIAPCQERACREAVGDRADLRVMRHTGTSLRFLGFDVQGETPFRDVRVRRAVSLALDRSRLLGALPGSGHAANQLVPPSIFGFNEDLPPLRSSPDEARALLAAAGYPSGFDVEFSVREIVGHAADEIRRMLAAVGIRARIVRHQDRAFFDVVARHPAFYLNRYSCDTGDAADVLNAGIHSVDPGRRLGTANSGGYRNLAVDAAIEESSAVLEPTARARRLKALMERLVEEMPWVPLYFEDDAYIVRSGVAWRPRADGDLLAYEVGEVSP